MSTTTHHVTAEQLAAMCADGHRYELVMGELIVISPAVGSHGRTAMRLGSLLEQHVRANRLGEVFAAETGFLLSTNPDTVRAPDVAFVRFAQIDHIENLDGYLPLAPDLVVEVVSPSDSSSQVEAKAEMWLNSGTSMVLVADPVNRSIRVYRTRSAIEVLHEGEELDAGDVVTGWRLMVADVFSN